MGEIYGLLGESLDHSLSPGIHSLILKKQQRKGCYHLFEIKREEMGDALKGIRALGIKGVNVTIPYKVEIMKYIDELSPEAKKIGAVNTLSWENHKIIGYNTDYYGFGRMLDYHGVDSKGKEAIVLGSGGGAKAVIQYLMDTGIGGITVVSRQVGEAKKDFKDLSLISYDELKRKGQGDLLINCTPCGMYPNICQSPVEQQVMDKFQWAVDLIYNPKETLFLKQAKEVGTKGINGLYMLVAQAVKAQEIWNKTALSKNAIQEIYATVADQLYG